MMSRITAEHVLNEATGGGLPREGDILIRRRKGWAFARLSEEGSTPAYAIANAGTDRAYDANAADGAADLAALKTVVAELADVLATLIADLKTKGILP